MGSGVGVTPGVGVGVGSGVGVGVGVGSGVGVGIGVGVGPGGVGVGVAEDTFGRTASCATARSVNETVWLPVIADTIGVIRTMLPVIVTVTFVPRPSAHGDGIARERDVRRSDGHARALGLGQDRAGHAVRGRIAWLPGDKRRRVDRGLERSSPRRRRQRDLRAEDAREVAGPGEEHEQDRQEDGDLDERLPATRIVAIRIA